VNENANTSAQTDGSPAPGAVSDLFSAIKRNIAKVIVGKDEAADLLLICLATGGHALIEDVPGLGKTSMVAALAASVDCSFQRVQFTPDVLPSDVTGFTMYHPVTGEEKFYQGAVMCNILLADELNRTSPKTQSALLQAMQEGAVTVDGVTRVLPRPFMVCATQNPVEHAGTYPLPEAQLDRFLMRIGMGYPSRTDEAAILARNRGGAVRAPLSPVANAGDVLSMQTALDHVLCSAPVVAYIVDIVQRTRKHEGVSLGVSPRGAIALMRASMGHALLKGRNYTIPDDVQAMANHTLCHRLIPNIHAYTQSQSAEQILADVLRLVPVPVVAGT